MRLKINLASQPYEDARHFLTQWFAVLGVLFVIAVVLSYAVITRWQQYRVMSSNIAREKQILADLENKQRLDVAILNKPENMDVRERSEYLNDLILRKEVSWTKIFTDLEKMMPAHLRVLSVQPKVEEGQIMINMQLGGDSRDRAAELVRRMEKSTVFRAAYITAEVDNQPAQGGGPVQGDPMRFQLAAEYVPGPQTTAQAAPAPTAKPDTSTGGGQ
jgi:hypothetical protein